MLTFGSKDTTTTSSVHLISCKSSCTDSTSKYRRLRFPYPNFFFFLLFFFELYRVARFSHSFSFFTIARMHYQAIALSAALLTPFVTAKVQLPSQGCAGESNERAHPIAQLDTCVDIHLTLNRAIMLARFSNRFNN